VLPGVAIETLRPRCADLVVRLGHETRRQREGVADTSARRTVDERAIAEGVRLGATREAAPVLADDVERLLAVPIDVAQCVDVRLQALVLSDALRVALLTWLALRIVEVTEVARHASFVIRSTGDLVVVLDALLVEDHGEYAVGIDLRFRQVLAPPRSRIR